MEGDGVIESGLDDGPLPESVGGVPPACWCYWAGGKMHRNRLRSFQVLQSNIGVPVRLVTEDSVARVARPERPIHPAFPLLSAVHQSDYLRAYPLFHYGGAWHDVKATEVNFRPQWQKFDDPGTWLIGRPEVPGGAARVTDADGRWMPDVTSDLVSAGYWIGRPRTPLSADLLDALERDLDDALPALRENPARHPRERRIDAPGRLRRTYDRIRFVFEGRNPRYPLPWTFFGNAFHPVVYRYRDRIDRKLPSDARKNAGIPHR